MNEARQALLLQRVNGEPNPAELKVREALEIATVGGASVLGRDDIGAIAVGMSADFIGYDLNDIRFAGALHDPVAAMVLCYPGNVDLSVINGKVVVQDGQFTTINLREAVDEHNRLSKQLINRE